MRPPAPLSTRLLSATVLLVPVIVLVSAIAAHRRHTPVAEAAAVATLDGVASNTREAMDKYMLRVLNQVLTLARVPAVRKQVEDSNAVLWDKAATENVDKEWKKLKGPPPSLESLLASESARFFRDLACPPEAQCALLGPDEVGSVQTSRLAHPAGALREVIVADTFGRLVVASNATSDYWQGDEEWFKRVLLRADKCAKHVSMGCIDTGSAEYDESAQSYGFDFAVPVQTESGATSGVLKALVDLEDIVAVLQAIQPPGIDAVLVDDNGDEINVPQKRRAAFAKAWVSEQLKPRPPVAQGSQQARSHVLAGGGAPGSNSDDGRTLAVLSEPLRAQQGWRILVWQSRAAALKPVSQQIWTTVTIVTIALLAALAVAIQLRPSRPATASTVAATEPGAQPEEVPHAMPR